VLKISRKGEYGLILLTALAQEGEGKPVSLREISRKRRMPYKFLSQIAPALVEAGILGSKEGVGGGYFLAREPSSINIGEVLEILEGPVAPVSCMREGCFYEPYCSQINVMKKMAATVAKAMREYTLSDLVGQ
jgi:Rrf2 family cysteine metabolism transcriptional repressor